MLRLTVPPLTAEIRVTKMSNLARGDRRAQGNHNRSIAVRRFQGFTGFRAGPVTPN